MYFDSANTAQKPRAVIDRLNAAIVESLADPALQKRLADLERPAVRAAMVKAGEAEGVPFVLNAYTRHVNPVKLREYLSAGLPVVDVAPVHVVSHGSMPQQKLSRIAI